MTVRVAWLLALLVFVAMASCSAYAEPASEATAAALLVQTERGAMLLEGLLWVAMSVIFFFGYSVGSRE